LNVLPEAKVSVNREGIYFEGMYYGCEELARQGWFVKGKTQKVPIAYDRRCMNHVYVKTDNGKGFIKCDLLAKSSRFINMSLEEVKSTRYEEKLSRSMYYDETELQEEVTLSAKLEAIKKEAMKRSADNQDHSLTKSERKSNIKGNKAVERDMLRKEQAYELGKSPNEETDEQSNPGDHVIPLETYRPKSKLGLLAKLKETEEKKHG